MDYRGLGVYTKYFDGATKEEYHGFQDTLKEKGFEEFISIDTESGICNSTYRRKEQFVTLTHWGHRTVAVYYQDTAYPKSDGKELFSDIPNMQAGVAGEPADYGAGCYVMKVEEIDECQYKAYLNVLESDGYIKYTENNLCATFRKESLVLHVAYIKKSRTTFLSACHNLPLADRLLPDNASLMGEGQHTKLHLPEMWSFGNSFVFQLKNGHFIIVDGGMMGEIGYLLDYIEGLAEGKPIIDAWFISHGHVDHCGVLRAMVEQPELTERIYVEGIYYNEPNHCVVALDPTTRVDIMFMKEAAATLKTTDGAHPMIYRPQLGQRYFFADIFVDIIFTQEQLLCENYYKGDFNDSSTWLMFHIEGQKILIGGDGGTGAMDFIISAYSQEEMQLDAFTTLHHCLNTMNYFTDYCSIKTAIFTRASAPRTRAEDNEYLKQTSEEWFSREEGPRVLTFPYKVGTSEILSHFEWIYHEGEEKPFS